MKLTIFAAGLITGALAGMWLMWQTIEQLDEGVRM